MANKAIDTKIPLMDAMGATKGMTPKQVSDRWVAWSAKYPDEKSKLGISVIVALDSLATMVAAYDTLVTVINTIETSVVAAVKTYKIALSLVPGVGAADAAKTAMEEAMASLKAQLAIVVRKIQQAPQAIWDSLVNVKVNEKAQL